MTTVKESLTYNINLWKGYYEKSLAAQAIVNKLPAHIQEMDGEFDHSFGSEYALLLTGEEAYEIAYDWGIIFQEAFVFTGANSRLPMEDMVKSTDFTACGTLSKDAMAKMGLTKPIKINVKVSKLPKPETCIIEAVTKTVLETKYVTKCIENEEKS